MKSDRSFKSLKKVFRHIAQEISTFDFHNVEEDVMKGVYQELIDLDTRHALGEYYTPDWLCERIVQEFPFKPGDRILDPSCGSGSFLRAAIHRIKELNPDARAEDINDQIYGFDIHPLSVQIAKTTLLVSLGKDIIKSKRPIHLNIVLANTLLAPDGVKNLFGGEFTMQIDKKKYFLNTQILDDVKLFDDALDLCEDLAEQTTGKKTESLSVFENILIKQYKLRGINQAIINSFYEIYKALKQVKEQGRDSIWKFIVQNLYKPYFLKEKFDYIIGNPPWFTYSDVRNEEYQDTLNQLAIQYEVKPQRVANYPHLEIAAIFMAYCSSYFLKENGKLAFVLPRSFFSADHHDNSRSGKAKGFRLTSAWDLNDVSPLFRVPSGVLFAEKAHVRKKIPASGIEGKAFGGRLPSHNTNFKTASTKLIEENVKWYYIEQGKSSALSNRKQKSKNQVNPYRDQFYQGATIVPRSFYFVELNQETPPDFEDRIINIKTSEAIKPDAKEPWKGIELSGKVESNFLFRTALAKSILPFALYKPDLIVVPVTTDKKNKIILHSAKELMQEGFLNASRWFQQAENIWNIHRTQKNEKISLENYLNWRNKLTEQDLNSEFIVLYNSSGKDANACVLIRNSNELSFLVDHKTYYYSTNSKNEAFYLAGILNSKVPNDLMKDFQSRGLYGARDVHKKVLDIYFPKYDKDNRDHIKLAEASEVCHEKAKEYLQENTPSEQLGTLQLGRLRTSIKLHLSKELKEIDKIVKKIIE